MVLKFTVLSAPALVALVLATSVHADEFDSNYYTITTVQTQEIPTTQTQDQTQETATAPLFSTPTSSDTSSGTTSSNVTSRVVGGVLDGVLGVLPGGLDISAIVNIGQQVWNIVQANEPVANVTVNSASMVPQGVANWQQLADWQAPQTKTYETSFQNFYGMTVVDFQYRVSYIPGGTYNGQGQYLANVTVQTQNLSVAWGYKFNAQVTIPSITNAGTTDSPIAAAEVLVSWTVNTILKNQQQSAEYYIRGDGQFEAL